LFLPSITEVSASVNNFCARAIAVTGTRVSALIEMLKEMVDIINAAIKDKRDRYADMSSVNR